MADLRVPSTVSGSGSLPVARPRTDTAREAQRAFFRAALGQQQAEPQAQAKPPTPSAHPASTQPEGQPQRLLRPGSLLDIKV